jgi:hypothetical protein
MPEDLGDHRRIFNACPERVEGAAMIFKAPPQFGQCSMSMSKTRLSSRAQIMRRRALPERERFCCAPSHWALKRMEANQM